MNLTPREIYKLQVFVVAELACKRKARGLNSTIPKRSPLCARAILRRLGKKKKADDEVEEAQV